jgi:tripartite-type tricarboxylate transporter receptor subunit TctC
MLHAVPNHPAHRQRLIRIARTAIASLALTSGVALAAYPDRPVRVVLGFAAGGGSDILLRSITPGLSEILGQAVVVDNRPGAAGNVAMAAVAKAAPDGYTLLMGTPGLATNPSLYPNAGFDPVRDFAPISLVGSVQNVLIVKKSLPVATVSELIAYARANPGKLNMASPGAGSSQHLAAELFNAMAGISMVHIAYKGGAPAMNDVMAGQVDLMFNVLPSALPQIKAGTVKALGVTGTSRSKTLGDVPTLAEAGLPGYSAVTWNGILAPAGTPSAIVQQLNQAIVKVMQSPAVIERLQGMGQDVVTSTPEAFATFIRDEAAKWRKTIEAAKIRIQ